ncbi:MAG: DUF1294 domain-containing protein [Peptostreptococcaceae bacterium]|nr:DUF1294 domain-containing protein [Peptostreptococcaceae bacterium]
MDTGISIFISIIVIWNLIVFVLYGLDKYNSKGEGHRISERTLLIAAFLFGGLGAFLGMHLFHHKTKHKKFIILIPVSIFVNILTVILLVLY